MFYFEKNWKWIVPIILLVFVPIVVQWSMTVPSIYSKNTIINDWIGFAGGYLGALLGSITALIGIHWTIKKNEELRNIQNRFELQPIIKIKPLEYYEIHHLFYEKEKQLKNIEIIKYNESDLISAKEYALGFSVVNLGKGYATDMLFALFDKTKLKWWQSIQYIEPNIPEYFIFKTQLLS